MIDGFETYSPELTEEDKKVAQWIARGIERRVGKDRAITNKEMRERLKERNIQLSGPKVRKIVQYIRVSGLVPLLMATSEGYCVARDLEEFDQYLESFRQRTRSMEYTLQQLKIQRAYASSST